MFSKYFCFPCFSFVFQIFLFSVFFVVQHSLFSQFLCFPNFLFSHIYCFPFFLKFLVFPNFFFSQIFFSKLFSLLVWSGLLWNDYHFEVQAQYGMRSNLNAFEHSQTKGTPNRILTQCNVTTWVSQIFYFPKFFVFWNSLLSKIFCCPNFFVFSFFLFSQFFCFSNFLFSQFFCFPNIFFSPKIFYLFIWSSMDLYNKSPLKKLEHSME